MCAKCTIWAADCIAGIKERVGTCSVDVVVTSPPYNIGKKYNRYRDDNGVTEYQDWMKNVSKSISYALSDNGSLFLNLGGKPSDPFWPIQVLECFRQDFKLQNTILWVKSIAIGREDVGSGAGLDADIAVGHYKPVNSKRYLNQMSEYIFHLTKNGDVELDKLGVGVSYQDKSNVGRWNNDHNDLRDRGNVWFIPYETINSSRPHPCVFPVKLPEMCIKLHGTKRTKLVMDPFLGTGSTAIACQQLNVEFVGFDIDSYYVRMARRSILAWRKQSRSPSRSKAIQVK
ncbi:MAG: site-specific DNA-methyltransferase [Nitrososphaerota archaeon]|nr:site-specific DNA-methyltransferase [Nitrososphaerota archaeon]